MPQPMPRFGQELGATLKLALPLAAAQLSQMAMGTTDTIFLGSLGRDALATGGLGAILFFSLMITIGGGLSAVGILVAHARGAGEDWRIGQVMRGGFLLAILTAIPPMLLLWNAEPILLALGEPAALAHSVGRYDSVLLFAMPASLLMATQRAFLAAMDRPMMVMIVSVSAIVINGVLNYSLIHGALGLPAMGYMGSCTATLITMCGMTAAIAIKMRWVSDLRQYRLFGTIDWTVVRELASLGWPIAITMAVEIMLFGGAAIVVGLFGATALAAHQISITIASTTFMVPLALSQTANVRVGFSMGAGSPRGARQAGIASFVLGFGFMCLTATLMITIPHSISSLYITSNDPAREEVVTLAVRLLAIAALFQVFDGAQTIAAGALRGLKDTRVPALAAAIGYWGIGFVVARFLGVHLKLGVIGIWWGLATGLAVVATLLTIRFWLLSAKLIALSETPRNA